MKFRNIFFNISLLYLCFPFQEAYSQYTLTTVTELASLNPSSIASDPNGQTLLMKDDTIYTYGTEVTDKYYCEECNTILDITFSNGDMYIANEYGGIVKRSGNETEVVTPLRASKLIADQFGNIYGVHLMSGLVFSDGQGWIELNTSNSDIPTNIIFDIAVDSSGILWMATQIGLISWNWLSFSIKSVPDELSEAFYDIAIDGEDNIWVTSAFGGVGKYDHSTWTTYPDDFSVFASARSLAIVNGTEVWTTEYGEGLYRYDGTGFDLVTYQELGETEWETNRVLFADNYDRLWIQNDFADLKYLMTDPSSILPVREHLSELTIFPNPSTGVLHLAMDKIEKGKTYTIQVYNSDGRKVLNEETQTDETIKQIQLINQPSGIYQVMVLVDGKSKYTGRVSVTGSR